MFCQLARKEISKKSTGKKAATPNKESEEIVKSEPTEVVVNKEETNVPVIDWFVAGLLVLALLAMTVIWWTEIAQVDLKANILSLAVCFLGYRVYKLEKEVKRLSVNKA